MGGKCPSRPPATSTLPLGSKVAVCKSASVCEAARGRPGPARRIIEFRARESRSKTHSACDEHLAVGQQRRRVITACGGEAAGGRPGPARRIVEFRARENADVDVIPPATSTLPLGSNVAV